MNTIPTEPKAQSFQNLIGQLVGLYTEIPEYSELGNLNLEVSKLPAILQEVLDKVGLNIEQFKELNNLIGSSILENQEKLNRLEVLKKMEEKLMEYGEMKAEGTN